MINRNPTFLMANLGSEVSRLLDWKRAGDLKMAEKCRNRAKNILMQINSFPEMKTRSAEMEILSRAIDDQLQKNQEFKIESQTLKNYFLPFARSVLKK